ncbi:MAG TPA: DUF5916 domain-containing protein [Gemmatimonadales bacterium]|nr:DUF5916 domain-containing protein [Gemmatimonadales bacterium]
MVSVLSALCLLQALAVKNHPVVPPPPGPATAIAAKAVRAPVIDGKDDDEVWRDAPKINAFQEFDPNPGKAPRFATEVRVAYDARNFYVFIRAFDPEPKRILKLLARRDIRTASDQLKIIVDSYHDRRSGYEFAVNPAGVKRDYAISNDGNEDDAWDGVWEAGTQVDSLGWTAEFRIPLSQMRYAQAESNTFGFAVWRDIDRYKERVSWPLYENNKAGLSSQLGEVHGLRGLAAPRRLEIAPYAVTKNITVPKPGNRFDHPQKYTGGLDFKYGLSSNLTIDGTVNPDFGQVESDPAVLNLGAFETFFQERRPFFIEGAGLLSYSINCYAVNDCGSENLFYSRRIGRAPQLAGPDDAANTGTNILGAAKLTGRTTKGLSIGLLDAYTGREEGALNNTIEPRTNYAVVRANQDLRGGQTSIGFIGTSVDRSLDPFTRADLRSSAMVGGLDFRHRFSRSRYEINARIAGSRVTGSAEAIDATQRSSVHYYQRPDGELDYDPTRTSLGGSSSQLKFGKVGGGKIRFETSYQRVSAGFEANDLGFLRRADWQDQATWATLQFNKPGPFFRRLFWNFNEWNDWTIKGLPLEHAVNSNVHFELPNSFFIHMGGTLGGLGTVYCDRCARGGPALRTSRYIAPWLGIQGDTRWVAVPSVWFNWWKADGGRSHSFNVNPTMDFRIFTGWTATLGMNYSWNTDDRQPFGNFTDLSAQTHYTFAHLVQRTASVQARANFTASPTLTFQAYVEPFISKGTYSRVRELNDPRADSYDARLKAYSGPEAASPGGFNFKQFRSNVVLRWEYRPGSALFLVWQQGRQDFENGQGNRSFRQDLSWLFDQAHPDNTFLVKISYWLDR